MLDSSLFSSPSDTRLVSGLAKQQCHQTAEFVALRFGIGVAEIKSITRGSPQAALARQIAMYLAHVVHGYGFAEIARCFGRDRTTVAHACRVVEDRRDDIAFDLRVAALEDACRAIQGGTR